MYEVGKRIKKVREAKGVSQKDFADKIRTRNTTVANWEKGLTRPDVDTLALICQVLDVSPDVLLDLPTKNNDNITHGEKDRLKKYRTLDEHGKEMVDSTLNIEYKRIQAIERKQEESVSTDEPCVIIYPIQEYEEKACAGTGNYLDYTTAFITELDFEPPSCADFIVTVSGDSMEPTFQDGDRIFIHRTKELQHGGITSSILVRVTTEKAVQPRKQAGFCYITTTHQYPLKISQKSVKFKINQSKISQKKGGQIAPLYAIISNCGRKDNSFINWHFALQI